MDYGSSKSWSSVSEGSGSGSSDASSASSGGDGGTSSSGSSSSESSSSAGCVCPVVVFTVEAYDITFGFDTAVTATCAFHVTLDVWGIPTDCAYQFDITMSMAASGGAFATVDPGRLIPGPWPGPTIVTNGTYAAEIPSNTYVQADNFALTAMFVPNLDLIGACTMCSTVPLCDATYIVAVPAPP